MKLGLKEYLASVILELWNYKILDRTQNYGNRNRSRYFS